MIGYLAGPIANCDDIEANGWRTEVKELAPEIEWLDPMARDFRYYGKLGDDVVSYIVEGDKKEIDSCDVVFANCWKPGWGTAMEIIYAHNIGKSVISIVPENVSISPWIMYHSNQVFTNLGTGINYLKTIIDLRKLVKSANG